MAELVAVVFEVTVKVAVHTTPGDRLEMVTVNGEMDVVTDELETTVLSESFLTVTSTVTPAPGSFELMATFASVWRPKLYTPVPITSTEKRYFPQLEWGSV